MVQYLKVGSKDIHEDGTVTYTKDWYRQGFVYKDEEAFLFSEDDICYIAEDDYPEEEIRYTRKDIMRICENNWNTARIVFYLLDWQHPSSVYDEYIELED